MKEIEALQEKVSSLSVQLLSKPKGTTCDIYTISCMLLSQYTTLYEYSKIRLQNVHNCEHYIQ